MQMPYQSQALQAERRSSSDLPPSFPAMEYGQDGSMESLDGLDMGLFAAQQSNSMPDYSDLTQAASQLQVAHGPPSLGARQSTILSTGCWWDVQSTWGMSALGQLQQPRCECLSALVTLPARFRVLSVLSVWLC